MQVAGLPDLLRTETGFLGVTQLPQLGQGPMWASKDAGAMPVPCRSVRLRQTGSLLHSSHTSPGFALARLFTGGLDAANPPPPHEHRCIGGGSWNPPDDA